MKIIFFSFIFLFVTSCASQLIPEARKVVLLDTGKPIPKNCKFITTVSITGQLEGNGMHDPGALQAGIDILNETYLAGGNLLSFDKEEKRVKKYRLEPFTISGRAYFCQ